MWILIAALVAAVAGIATAGISAGANAAAVDDANKQNAENVDKTNEANLQAVRETNAASVEQANIAYQRSLPVNQVHDLMAAGMSRAGALQKLAGGGSYTAPALQTATAQPFQAQAKHYDLSQIGDVIDRLGNIPSNVDQAELVRTQIDAAKADAEYKRAEEQRRQEQHDMEMDERLYNRWERESMDNFFSKMQSVATEKNIQPGENDSFEQYVRKLGLSGDNDYKKLPVSAHERIFERYKVAQQEKRDQRSADDTHAISSATLDKLREEVDDYKAEKDARRKEYKVRLLAASVEEIMQEMNLSKAELRKSMNIEYDKDGKPRVTPHKGVQGVANEFWQTVGSVIGLEYIGDILAHILKAGVK